MNVSNEIRFLKSVIYLFLGLTTILVIAYFIGSKGPADLQAVLFAEQVLSDKLGPIQKTETVKVLSYADPKDGTKGVGVYELSFSKDGYTGTIECSIEQKSKAFSLVSFQNDTKN